MPLTLPRAVLSISGLRRNEPPRRRKVRRNGQGTGLTSGLVFDACVGPFCGELDATNYLNQVVDQTTEDERLNGFFAPDRGGRIINESPVFKMR